MNINFFEIMKQADNIQDGNNLPDGWYQGTIEECEIRETKACNGNYIMVKIRDINNWVHFCNINIINPNPTAVNIGLGLLKALKGATGVMSAESPVVFEGKKIEFLLKTNKNGDQNVSGFRAVNRASIPAAISTTGTTQPADANDMIF